MQTLRRIALFIVLPVVLWLGLVLSGALPRITPAQKQAIATLHAASPQAAGEHNAFGFVWLSLYDIPADQIDAVTKADTEAFAQRLAQGKTEPPFVSSAEGKYPRLPQPAAASNAEPALCKVWEGGCLAKVKADPAATRARLAELARTLEHDRGLARYDHYLYGFTPSLDSPLLPGARSFGALERSDAALAFADGDHSRALDQLCAHAATWRRLRAHTDMLLIDMLGSTQLSNAAALYADMLAELPADSAVPAACEAAFAPLAEAEFDQCPMLRTEYRLMEREMRGLKPSRMGMDAWFDAAAVVLHNPEHTVAVLAERYAILCSDEHQQRIAQRAPFPPAPLEQPSACTAGAWAFNPIGCILIDVAVPSFEGYYRRLLDLDARLRLVGSARWLAPQPAGTDRAAAFAERPAALRSSQQNPATFDVARATLRVSMPSRPGAEVFEIALPGTREARP